METTEENVLNEFNSRRYGKTTRIIDGIRKRWPDVKWRYEHCSGWYLGSDDSYVCLTISIHDDDDVPPRIYRYFPDGLGKTPEAF